MGKFSWDKITQPKIDESIVWRIFGRDQMPKANPTVKRLLDKWPGKKYFGIYRFLPLFFVLGATLEFSMINWNFGEVNFYRTYKRRKAHEIAESSLNGERGVV